MRASVVAVIAGLVVLYAVVVLMYALGSRPVTEGLAEIAPADGIGFTIQPQSVNTQGNRFEMTIDLTSEGPLENVDGQLSEPVSLAVTENDGPRLFEFPADTLNSPISVNLMTDGYVELWPFDRYTVVTTIVAAHGAGDDPTLVEPYLSAKGGVPGWLIEAHTEMRGAMVGVNGQSQEVPSVVITASRSGAIVAFGLVILGLMVVMPILSLTIAILAYRGVRKVEATLMSWMAAMLFATIPLRTFLPGSPPIGSWIDYLIVLWVVAGLVLALVIYVAAWVRWTPPAAGFVSADADGAGADGAGADGAGADGGGGAAD